MGQVLVVTSGKGGVGKTTMAANLGYGLSLQNRKVVLVDFDLGLRNLDIIMGVEHRVVYHIGDVLNGVCQLKQALLRDKRMRNLWFLPGSLEYASEIEPYSVNELMKRLRKEYDYVIVDGPAGVERGFQLATSVADQIILVVNPEMCSVRDSNQVMDYILRNYRIPIRLIVNRTRNSLFSKQHYLSCKDIEDMLMLEAYGVIPNDEQIIAYSNEGEFFIGKHTRAGQALMKLSERIIFEDGECELCLEK